MPVYRLPEIPVFPHPFEAEPDGWLAVGGDLSPERLITAYTYGIFPWFSEGEEMRWYAPIPRFGLFPNDLKVSKSLRQTLRNKGFQVTFNRAFESVIKHCQTIERNDQWGTWITKDMLASYIRLHHLGWAHSVEVWQDDQLVGGLYGLKVGKIFCGESMFALVADASKVAFVHLVRSLENEGFIFVDCQQETEHLKQFGARLVGRDAFWEMMHRNLIDCLQ
jgi:leucyl/phenylalanyl-tRNA--protein transferase